MTNKIARTGILFVTFATALGVSGCATSGGRDAESASPTTSANIVDTAVGAGFNTLAAALTAADLADTLKGSGPFTVFAPTDAAFAKLPPGTVENLLKPENKGKLQSVLKYHVVAGKVGSAEVVKLNKATTLQAADVDIKVDGGKVFVNGAQVTTADVLASNGVIHVIDTVLLPPA